MARSLSKLKALMPSSLATSTCPAEEVLQLTPCDPLAKPLSAQATRPHSSIVSMC